MTNKDIFKEKRESYMKNATKRVRQEIWKNRYLYLFLIPGVLFFAIFSYKPMAGIILAFKKYNASLGIFGSKWVGFQHFERMFRTGDAIVTVKNTLIISLGRLVFEFPFPILLAILINEMRGKKVKRVYQTIYTFPHFLSWVLIGTILTNFLSDRGTINSILRLLGQPPVNFLANVSIFRGVIYITSIWKSAGWSAVIYMAAIAGISPEQYEAALVDGANRLQRIWHITLPGIRSTIIVLFILQVGNMMNGGFDQIFNIYNPVVKPVSNIIDTYVYSITFESVADYGFSTAVGLFKSVVNIILLLVANKTISLLGEGGLSQ